MTCNPDNDWTFRFDTHDQTRVLNVRPVSMDMELSRAEYDFCRAKFDPEVGEKIKPYTRAEHGVMNETVRVRVYCGDNLIQIFICRPDYIKFGTDYTRMEFHDLHEALSNGLVNIQQSDISLRSIYEKVFEQAETPFIHGMEFTELADEQVDRIIADKNFISEKVDDFFDRGIPSYQPLAGGDQVSEEAEKDFAEAEPTTQLIDSKNAVDFENISPEKAIERLNQLFRLNTWVTKGGTLKVGSLSLTGNIHMAAPDDERVWRYKNASISHGREPIKKIVVVGKWIDEAGLGGLDEAASKVASFVGGGGDSNGADVRIVGIAERPDINYGDTAVLESPGAKKDGIKEIATTELKYRMANHFSGRVEIDTDLSGEQVSNLRKVYPSDLIRLVPNDGYFDEPTYDSGGVYDDEPSSDEICGGFVNNERYQISEVRHNLSDDGNWDISLNCGLVPDIDIESRIEYYDPYNNKFLDDDEAEEFEDDNSWQLEDYE